MKTIIKLLALVAAVVGVYAAVIYIIDSKGRNRDDRRHIARLKRDSQNCADDGSDGIADYRDESEDDEPMTPADGQETSAHSDRSDKMRSAVGRLARKTEQVAGRAAEKVAEKATRFAQDAAEHVEDAADAPAVEPSEDALEQMLDE